MKTQAVLNPFSKSDGGCVFCAWIMALLVPQALFCQFVYNLYYRDFTELIIYSARQFGYRFDRESKSFDPSLSAEHRLFNLAIPKNSG